MDSSKVLLKWVGDPTLLAPDMQSIADWGYENKRVIAIAGNAIRELAPDVLPGLSRSYRFGGKVAKNMIQEVDALDAKLIMDNNPFEFKDVTNVEYPEYVLNDRYILPKGITARQFMAELVRRRRANLL